MTREIQGQAAATLARNGNAEAAKEVAAFIVDDDKPFVTGRSFLASYPLSYSTPDGKVHLRSVGLFQDYDSWITSLLPKILQGQSYCHLPTAEYLIALATKAKAPGTMVSTADDAATTPGN